MVPPAILIVDPEDLLRWALREVLSEAGFEVRDVGTAGAARAWLGQSTQLPAVAFVDRRLPDASSVEIIQAVKTLAPSCYIIAMTDGTSQDEREALHAGAADVLVKPLHLDRTVAKAYALTGFRPKLS